MPRPSKASKAAKQRYAARLQLKKDAEVALPTIQTHRVPPTWPRIRVTAQDVTSVKTIVMLL